jgi:hypothetical protein
MTGEKITRGMKGIEEQHEEGRQEPIAVAT